MTLLSTLIGRADGGGLVNTQLELTAISYENPGANVDNPFTNAANSANITRDVDNYADKAMLVSTSSNEPIQFPQRPTVPTGATGYTFTLVVEPETGNSWDEGTIVIKVETAHITDETAKSSVTTYTLTTKTTPASGSAPLVISATATLAQLGLAVGDNFECAIVVDSTSTWANDVAILRARGDVSNA